MPRLSELTRDAVLAELAAAFAELPASASVAIDGPDAAGKTTLADELARLLGGAAVRISADDFLNPPEIRYRRGRESPEGYSRDSIDHRALRAAVKSRDGLLLVDGIFLCVPELDDLWDLRVFVAVSEKTSLSRGLDRDGPDMEHLYRVRYLPGQRLYARDARPRERADVVVENDDPDRPRLVWRKGLRPPGA